MKPIKSLLVLAILCTPLVASAQGYYGRRHGGGAGPTAAGGFHDRTGRLTFGGSIGLGAMHDGGSAITTCSNCDIQPLAFEADAHIGGVLNPRLALMLELQGNIQTVHSNAFDDDTVLTQGAAMFAAQFWILPQLWIKGGLGFASLQVDDRFFLEDFGTGGAFMGALGVELMSAHNFALELQGRLLAASYNSLDDNVTSATVGIGINWY
jgi:hypothetical protein